MILTSLLIFSFGKNAQAQFKEFREFKELIEQSGNNGDSIGTEYYTIVDENEVGPEFFTPLNVLDTLSNLNSIHSDSDPEQNLLKWVRHETSNPDTPEKYQRKNHFGTWIRDPSYQTCLNVRGLVLKRDAVGEITYADEKHCRIVSSRWIDPYTNSELESAADIQIDHMVPLKNAYISGAWNWTGSQRCNYANFMGNNFHLLAVLGTENSKKSDHTPDKYIPPSSESVCHYLVNWLKIKSIWNLKIAKNEALAIERELKTYDCAISDFQLNWNELNQQRAKTHEYPKTCENFGNSAPTF
jgi:hypothetical protein